MNLKKLSVIITALILAFNMLLPVFAEEETKLEKINSVSSLTDGEACLFVMNGITPTGMSSGSYALKSESKTDKVVDFAAFSTNMDPCGFLWEVEAVDGGYALRAADGANEGKYLVIGEETLSFSDEPAALSISGSGDNNYIKNLAGNYRLRFTNSVDNTCGFVSGTKDASTAFAIYHQVADDVKEKPAVPEYVEMSAPKGNPLITIGCISDLHMDYGIPDWDVPMRTGTIKTCKELRKLGIDVLLVGGDITSNNDYGKWNLETFEKVKKQVRKTTLTAVESGRVLYTTGNHEYAAGGKSFNSGDYYDIMKEDTGEFVNAYYLDAEHNYLLAYHYFLEGFHFVVIDTPYNGDDNHGSYVYTQGTIAWLEKELESIGNDKTVFVLGHYPLRDSNGISSVGKGLSDQNDLNGKLKAVFLKYPNSIYLYGHDHGGPHFDNDVLERLTPYSADGTPLNYRTNETTGPVTCFVGSMSYYQGWLGADQPAIVQALIIKAYDDRVIFEIENYGSKTGISENVKPYTSAREVVVDNMIYTPVAESDLLCEEDFDASSWEFTKAFVTAAKEEPPVESANDSSDVTSSATNPPVPDTVKTDGNALPTVVIAICVIAVAAVVAVVIVLGKKKK